MPDKTKKWKLRSDILISQHSENQIKVIYENGKHIIHGDTDELIKKLKILRESGIRANLENEPKSSLLKQLENAELLILDAPNNLNPIQELAWYWGEHVLPSCGLYQRICNSSVAIVGCGGTGCIIAQSLAGSGVGTFTLIDFDRVTIQNLNRQFVFCLEDVGEYKAEALARRISQSQQVSKVYPIVAKIKSDKQLVNILKKVDIIICCADTPPGKIQQSVAGAAKILETTVLFGAVGILNGTIGPLLKKKQDIDEYLKWIEKVCQFRNNLIITSNFPSNGVTNSLIANLISMEALCYLANLPPFNTMGTSINFDFKRLIFTPMQNFLSN